MGEGRGRGEEPRSEAELEGGQSRVVAGSGRVQTGVRAQVTLA